MRFKGIMRTYKALLTSIKSVYGQRFCQRLGVASRSGWACLLVGLLLQFGSPINKWMAIPFALVISLNIVESSLGSVLWNVVDVLVGMGQAMIIGLVVLLSLGTKLSLAPAIICIFVASFCVTYPDGIHQMARKVALSHIGIIFVTAHSGQNGESIFFLVRLMATTLVGAFCAILAVLIPLPGLPCWEARESARSTIRADLELFKSLVKAFCARDGSTLSSIFLQVNFLANAASTSLSELNSKQLYAIWELRGFGLIPTFKRTIKGLNGLKLHLLGMSLALQSGTILLTPSVMSAILKDPLKTISHRSKSILDLTTKLSKSKAVLSEKQKHLEEGKAELKIFDQMVMVAREETYYRDTGNEESLSERHTIANSQGSTANVNIQQLLRTMGPTYFFLFNLRMFFTETINMVDSGKIANKMHQMAKQNIQRARPVRSVSDQAPQPQPTSDEDQAPQPQPTSDEESGSAAFTPSNCTSCNCRFPQPKVTSNEACLKWLEKHGLKVDHAHFVRAFKISLAMALAALGGIRFNIHYAFWANITVGFIIQNHQGGSFRMANLRLQGTVIGATYGYLAILIIREYPYLVLISLIPWVVVLSYLRFTRIFGPAGVIAGLTAAIIMLGDKVQPIQDFALVRITENFIGVLFLVVVETVVWPNRAVTLSRKELVSSLTDLRDCVAAVTAAYTGHYCPEHRGLVVQEIKKLEQQLRARFSEQVALHSEAILEPDLWNVPFPAEIYSKLVRTQGRMLDLLYFMVSSLHAATEDSLSEQIEKLVGPLQSSLVALEVEVLSSLDLLQKVLQVKRNTIPHLSKTWSCEEDEETQLGGAQGILCANLGNTAARVHPLLLLECRQRALDGTPLSMKSTIEAFEASHVEVVS